MDSATIERGIAGLEESCARGHDATGLFGEMSDRLQRLVPFDGALWFATDPATVLATAPARIENVEDGHCETYWEREFRVEDALLFRDLARTDTGVGTLYDVTGGNPGRSARHREFGAPQGYGDEMRAALRVGTSTWGVLSLMRERGRAPFGARDVELVRAIAPVLGDALRMLAVRTAAAVPADLGPGTALYGPDGVLLSLDEPAERLFQELGGPGWLPRTLPMTPVSAVLAQALAVEQGRERGPASARVRAATGRWLSLHASCLRGVDGQPGPVALTIEPAKSAQLAPIIVEAYRLTVREQEITRAVARGLSNPEIAAQLFLSPHTVRDHLKAVFAKVGVASRGELVATLFADHYAPALHAPGVAVEHVHRG
ncbi:helix-turn-helix transcriptional regulator [Blastococcus sp. URHD0036]|uniref:helix-turn-helix transcriptional regulator n=1 Tax=Blastococcus sp. URHD0036 TaxID=1380356 RepID=UPI00068927E8|nr:helix-turn-helix transcriptional regulator [Blastococcus sp. URHD0036]